jgi:chemotaxis protein MotB
MWHRESRVGKPKLPDRSRLSHDRWLVSYADFMTLLFAFFATMYASSSVDARKLATVAHALQVAFEDSAHHEKSTGGGIMPDRGTRIAPAADEAMPNVQATLQRELADELRMGHVELIIDRRGVILSIPEAGAFDTGSDEVSPAAQALIGRIAITLARFRNSVRVEGHTDNRPIHTVRFRSNWDLSAARASRVVEYLIDRGLDSDRLSATGYAEFHPRAANDSDAARASNRRVDLVILNPSTNIAEEPAAEGARP